MPGYRPNDPLRISFNFGMTPGVKLLLIVNVAVFILSVFFPALNFWGGLTPAIVLHGAIWQIFTYQFLHASGSHIVFNMLALWMFGVAVEGAWGQRRFLQYYLVCGAGAGVCVFLVALIAPSFGDPQAVTIGASGAIFGILLAFGMMYPNAPVYIFMLFPVPGKWMVIIYGALEFFGFTRGGGNVSHAAHLGGLLVGYLYMKYSGFTSSSYGYSRYGRRSAFAKIFSPEEWRVAMASWRRRRLRKKFDVYMSKNDKDDFIQ